MRRLTYVLTEIGAHVWLKVAVVGMTTLVIMSSIQFFQAYDRYLEHTQALTENFGSASSIRFVDISAESISSKDILAVIDEGQALFGDDVYYYLQGGDFFAEADAFVYSEGPLAIENQFGQSLVQPQIVIMNQALVEKADFRLASGRQLEARDFADSGNGILLGSHYRENYQIGDDFLLQSFVGISEAGQVMTAERTYQVKGFLTEAHSLLNFWQGRTEEILLDEMIVIPLTEDLMQSDSDNLSVQIMGFFYMLSAKEEEALNYLDLAEAVKEIGARHGYSYLAFSNDRSIFDFEINMYRSLYQNQLFLLLLLLVFATVQTGMIVHFSFKKRQSVYAAYLGMGSTKAEIFTVISLHYLLLFAVAWALLYMSEQLFIKENWLSRQVAWGTLFYLTFYGLTVLTILINHCFPGRKLGKLLQMRKGGEVG